MNAVQEKTNMTITLDKPTKEEFGALCDELGLSMSSCVIALMRQAVRQQGITLTATDENGFSLTEAAELKRRVQDVKQGHIEQHDLIEV